MAVSQQCFNFIVNARVFHNDDKVNPMRTNLAGRKAAGVKSPQ
jgi:hypothetical protein